MKHLLIPLLAVLLSSCMTFDKAKRKYAKSQVDTTYQTVSVSVPHDSAVLHIVTDTTTITREVRQGRARIIYQRNAKTTIVKADCDSVVVEKKAPQYITKQVWGVDPAFEQRASLWRLAALLLAGVIAGATIIYAVNRKYQLSVTKR